ncbi:MAG: ABC transporter permease [Mycobacteriales bacterium]
MELDLRADLPVVARRQRNSRRRKRLAPYALLLPGWLWLVAFFVVPTFVMLSLSLQTGSLEEGYRQTFNWSTYSDALTTYRPQLTRSLVYALIVTGIALVVSYPMAYWIAFHGGHRKSSFLLLLLLPFFVSFVIRTLSWQFLLSDDGIVLGPLKRAGLLTDDFHILATSAAVIGGLVYNFLPFMALPLYVALERIDPKLLEAAGDLYANRAAAFWHVVLPLSLPGVFAGVLLTFVPAAADFINAAILGGTNTTMIGTIIQSRFLTNNDYPKGAALSFILMAILLAGVFAYAKVLGTEEALDASAA